MVADSLGRESNSLTRDCVPQLARLSDGTIRARCPERVRATLADGGMMTKTKIADRIFVVRFDTLYELASTFLRFQEHYESPRFRNRIFSLEEFMDWYAEKTGAFTYFTDWSGFNVPSSTFEAFYRGKFNPLL